MRTSEDLSVFGSRKTARGCETHKYFHSNRVTSAFDLHYDDIVKLRSTRDFSLYVNTPRSLSPRSIHFPRLFFLFFLSFSPIRSHLIRLIQCSPPLTCTPSSPLRKYFYCHTHTHTHIPMATGLGAVHALTLYTTCICLFRL